MDEAHENTHRRSGVRLLPTVAVRYLDHEEVRTWLNEAQRPDEDGREADG